MVCKSHERPIIPSHEERTKICSGGKLRLYFRLLFLTLVPPPQAFHIYPNDKAVLYNIAMIQQKSAELLFSINVAKRTLKDLQKVIDSATHAQK